VFSLGCNGISGFEEDIKARYPHCVIHIYDPTTSERTAGDVEARTQVPNFHLSFQLLWDALQL
jgi:hypothetical protein